MMKIDIKSETFEFFKNLIHEIETQDNRCTALPILFVLKETRREYGIDPEYNTHGFEWIKDGESASWETIEEIIQQHFDNYDLVVTEEMAEEYGYYKCYYRNVEQISDNFFFTEKACKQHLICNGHNLISPQDWAIHPFRNPEIEQVIESIREIVKAEQEGGK
jgi:hypothetical protein